MRLPEHSIMPFPIEVIEAVVQLTDSVSRSVKDLASRASIAGREGSGVGNGKRVKVRMGALGGDPN